MPRKRGPKSQKTAREKSAEDASQLKLNLDDINQQHSEIDSQSYTKDDLISAGSTMQNLSCSGFASGGYKKGSINTLCGTSDSGKTVIAMTSLAATAANKNFDKYDLVMNNGEVKGSFNLEKMFPPLVGRLVDPPGGFSQTIQEFAGSMMMLCKGDRPFYCVLDSLDSLKSDSDFENTFAKAVKTASGDLKAIKEIKASYNTEKAKTIRKTLSEINDMISGKDSMLLIIQQLTQKIGATQFEEKFQASGGTAPKYYSTHQHWVSSSGKITKSSFGKQIEIGNGVSVKCKKNHLWGAKRNIEFNIFHEFGIDDIESILLFLCGTRWRKPSDRSVTASTMVSAPEFASNQIKFKDLLSMMWDDPKKNILTLRSMAEEMWSEREKSLHTGRTGLF